MTTRRLTVAQALVHFLAAQYSERDGVRQRLIRGVWAIFGHGNVAGLGQALAEYGARLGLPTYRPQHEQAMVHAAAAFARHTERLSTFACTASIGPGSTNMLTAAAGATINRLPVLLLPADAFANRVPDPVLQQLEHPLERDVSVNDAFRPLSRFFARITRPEQLLDVLPEAMRVLTDPAETGAVTVALPQDVQAEAYDWPVAFLAERVWPIRRPVPDPAAIAVAAQLLRQAERPLVIVGGGARYSAAGEALAALASRFGLPVAETQAGKGVLSWQHPWNVGPIGVNGGLAANRLARQADLILAVGTRLTDFTTASKTAFQHPAVRVIGLNINAADAAKLGGVALVGDARQGVEALAAALSDWPGTAAPYRAEVAQLRAEWDAWVAAWRTPPAAAGPRLRQAAVLGVLNTVVGGRATVINAAGSMPGDLVRLWRAEEPAAYHVEYGYSCMGYELPAGIGVKLAEPDRDVVVLVGDGSYLMASAELVTAVAEGLDLTVVLMDNGGFGSIHGLQQAVGSPPFGNLLRARNPATGQLDGPPVVVDYVQHAAAMGARAWAVTSYEELAARLAEARRLPGVKVLIVPVDPDDRLPGCESWWDVPVAAVSEQPAVQAARQAYEQARQHQRWFGAHTETVTTP